MSKTKKVLIDETVWIRLVNLAEVCLAEEDRIETGDAVDLAVGILDAEEVRKKESENASS